ncbi:MAG: glycoside hydrolase family 3 protein [Eubacteriales bacterium]|nr:glycoside hydrolase family 3 protein [Eubacteriales bacterium]
MNKTQWISEKMGQMTLPEKVGQLLVLGFSGPVITPDIVELVEKYHVGGFRITQGFRFMTLTNDVKPGEMIDPMTAKSLYYPTGKNRDCCTRVPIVSTAREYAGVLNDLRSIAMNAPHPVPLHFTIDQEGSASDDLLSGQRLFPHPMGLLATGDPALAYRVGKSIALQARELGANMIHSPTVDVNTNPRNPEIGTRAYSSRTDEVTKYALQTLRGFQEEKLIATAKHFPGRGESEADAHWGLPSVSLDRKTLLDTHVAPYRALIAAGLPAIMIAHTSYPALGVPEGTPAGMSRTLVTDFLRGELGFGGVITTDNMMMGGVLKQCEMTEAIVGMLKAGCDLVLCRDESPIRIRICERILAAVKSGELPEKELDAKVERILAMRYDMGLAENGGLVDATKAGEAIDSAFVRSTALEAADRSTLLQRNTQGLLPLNPDAKVLLVEQIFPTHERSNNLYSHPGLLWEELCRYSRNVGSVEIPNTPTEVDYDRVRRRLDEADVIVTTNYYYHKTGSAISPFIREMMQKKPVVVISNTPYDFSAPTDFGTVITCFNPGGRECLNAVARMLYGQLTPTATLECIGN